jgi:hypothetical protein
MPPLIDMLEGMKLNMRKWAESWTQEGVPDASYDNELHCRAAATLKAYREATDEVKNVVQKHLAHSELRVDI